MRDDVRVGNAHVGMPFDPNAVIDNLRLERYAIDHNLNGTQPLPTQGAAAGVLLASSFLHRAGAPAYPKGLSAGLGKACFSALGRWTAPWKTSWKICLIAGMKAQGADGSSLYLVLAGWRGGVRGDDARCGKPRWGATFSSKLMDINDEYGIKASFQVVPEKRYEVPESYLSSIRDRGFEVAVQDLNHDGHLYSKRDEFLRRAELIRKYRKQYRATGFRAAILYRNLEWLPELDFSYDMSVSERGASRSAVRRVLHAVPVFHRQDAGNSGDHHAGLFAVPHHRRIQPGSVEEAGQRNPGKARGDEFHRAPGYIVDKKPQQTYRELLG